MKATTNATISDDLRASLALVKPEASTFERLAAIDVGKYTEKKNGLTYLSWAWAWDQLLRQDPSATFEYGEPRQFGGETLMVFCTVTAFGKAHTAHLPVMDHRNKAIANPDAFAVNTAMQRALVKAIAMHGLGLYIYAGEDLPQPADYVVAVPVPRLRLQHGAAQVVSVTPADADRRVALVTWVDHSGVEHEAKTPYDIKGGAATLAEQLQQEGCPVEITTRVNKKGVLVIDELRKWTPEPKAAPVSREPGADDVL